MAEYKEVKSELRYIGKNLIKYMSIIIDEQGHNASGKLIKGFYYNVTESKGLIQLSIGNHNYYWEMIDNYGKQRYPATTVKRNVILRWMKSKGFQGDREYLQKVATVISGELSNEGWPTETGMSTQGALSNFSGKADMMAEQEGLYNGLDSAFSDEVDDLFRFLNEEGNIIDVVAG